MRRRTRTGTQSWRRLGASERCLAGDVATERGNSLRIEVVSAVDGVAARTLKLLPYGRRLDHEQRRLLRRHLQHLDRDHDAGGFERLGVLAGVDLGDAGVLDNR